MNIKVCDACQRVLEDEIRDTASDWRRMFDLCVECKEKFEQIKKDYQEKDDELQEERKKLYNKYIERLNGMGIKYEK